MTNSNKFIEEILNGFQINRGKGSVYVTNPEIVGELVYNLCIKYNAKNPTSPIIFICDKSSVANYIRKSVIKLEPNYDKLNLKILSTKYISDTINLKKYFTITYGIEGDLGLINHIATTSKFCIALLREHISNGTIITTIRTLLPNIRTTVTYNDINNDRIKQPVREEFVEVSMNENDANEYKIQSEFINDCVIRFGSFDNIAYCRSGNQKLNKSAAQCREEIAISNGWSYNLDVSNSYLKDIDDAYNPNKLKELSESFYAITKKRRDLVCNSKDKFPVILDIVRRLEGKRICIVSNNGSFANEITNYINDALCDEVCLGYHDNLTPAYIRDDNGDVIIYKSGENKGQPKLLKSKALQSLNLASFLAGRCRILSIKNSSDIKLSGTFDAIIFTSGYCSDIIEFKSRFNKISISGNIASVYRIYCSGTTDETKCMSLKLYPNVDYIKPELDLMVNEDTGDIIL